jgi:hypothetical protein
MAAFADTFARQRREFPKIALPLIAKVENGSMAAAVKLKCLDCSGWVKAEVRDCVIRECPLYPVRPYQKIRTRNPNDVGQPGMTARLRESIGLPPVAR